MNNFKKLSQEVVILDAFVYDDIEHCNQAVLSRILFN